MSESPSNDLHSLKPLGRLPRFHLSIRNRKQSPQIARCLYSFAFLQKYKCFRVQGPLSAVSLLLVLLGTAALQEVALGRTEPRRHGQLASSSRSTPFHHQLKFCTKTTLGTEMPPKQLLTPQQSAFACWFEIFDIELRYMLFAHLLLMEKQSVSSLHSFL